MVVVSVGAVTKFVPVCIKDEVVSYLIFCVEVSCYEEVISGYEVLGVDFSIGDKHAAIVRTVLMFIPVNIAFFSTARLYNVYGFEIFVYKGAYISAIPRGSVFPYYVAIFEMYMYVVCRFKQDYCYFYLARF